MPQTPEQRRISREANKEKINARQREHYAKNKEAKLAKQREYRERCAEDVKRREKERRESFPERHLLHGAKQRARRFDLPFNLELDDCIVPERCPVLGIEFEQGEGRPLPGSPTLDRIVPELGYVKGNVIVVSHLANTIKTYATIEQIEAVVDFYKNLEIARQVSIQEKER